MTGAMYAAIGGLKSHMSNLNVIGNNIANVNTVGYKAQRMTFQESIYTMSRAGSNGGVTTGGNNPSQIGYGSSVGSIDLNMAPSTFSPTGYGLDCMMMGEGFFLVGDKGITVNNASDLSKFNLTRVGDFWKDPKGFFADRGGQVVYGFSTVQNPFKGTAQQGAQWLGYSGEELARVQAEDCDTIVSTQMGEMKLPVGAAAPTKENGGITADGVHRWDEGDPVYDLMGPVAADEDGNLYRGTVSLSDIVTKAVANTDTTLANQPAGNGVTKGAWGTPPNDGQEVWFYEDPENPGCRVTLDKNKNVLRIEFRDGTGRADGGATIGATTNNPGGGGTQTTNQLAATKPQLAWPTTYDKDGNPTTPVDDQNGVYFEYNGPIPHKDCLPIEPSSMSITAQGGIACQDSNSNTVLVGYVGVGSAASNDGVTHIGGCYYKAQEGAGAMRVAALGGVLKGLYLNNQLNVSLDGSSYQPAASAAILAGGTNEIKNAGLEASSTDVATEFSNMIITQRGYQANTRIITVTDSMLEELVNMKR